MMRAVAGREAAVLVRFESPVAQSTDDRVVRGRTRLLACDRMRRRCEHGHSAHDPGGYRETSRCWLESGVEACSLRAPFGAPPPSTANVRRAKPSEAGNLSRRDRRSLGCKWSEVPYTGVGLCRDGSSYSQVSVQCCCCTPGYRNRTYTGG